VNRAIVIVLVLVASLLPAAAAAWTLDLADTVRVANPTVRVADVARGEIPAAAGAVVVAAGGRPGASVEISSRAVLRRLVLAGAADDVRLAGADRCRIVFAGAPVATGDLVAQVREVLAPHLPEVDPEAPPSWLALEVPAVDLHTAGDWSVTWPDPRPLEPGRNLVTVAVCDGEHRRRVSVVAEVHCYARTAVPAASVPRGQDPDPAAMQWAWTDLAQAPRDVVTDPKALAGMIASRDLNPGEAVSARDLEPRPLVQRGETVDLLVRRGGVAAVVRAECRQDGLLGEMVSVRNNLNGRLVVVRVSGPGVVTLGR
jgi:flagella basal body P-ring formation protein FlgA